MVSTNVSLVKNIHLMVFLDDQSHKNIKNYNDISEMCKESVISIVIFMTNKNFKRTTIHREM